MAKMDESKFPELSKMKLEDEFRLISKNDRIHRVFVNYWQPHLTKGTECFEALTGTTFTAKEKADMKAIDKIAIEVPVILPKMNILSGFQRSSRRDGVVVGQGGEDSASAEVVNILLRTIRQQNNLDQERSKVFQDAMITGMPCFLWIDYDYTGESDKDLIITAESWNSVLISPNFTKQDLSDTNEIIRIRVMDIDQLIAAYPNREDVIMERGSHETIENRDTSTSADREDLIDNANSTTGSQETGLFTVLERNFFILKVRDVYIAPHSQEPEILPDDWSNKAKAEWEAANPEYQKVKRKVRTLWVTTTTESIVLENREHWFQEKCFPCSMFVPAMINNTPRGWVEFLIPQQRMHNVGRTEYIHSARFANDKTMITKEGVFADPVQAMNEKQRTGGVMVATEDSDVNQDIRFLQDQGGNQAMLEMSGVAEKDLETVSAINPAMGGAQESANETASGYSRRVSQAQTAQGQYMDNFMLFDTEVHKTLIKAFPFVYNEERVLRYVKDDNTPGEETINKVVERDPITLAVTRVVNRLDASRYDYLQSVGDNSVTGKENEFGAFLKITQEVLGKLPPEQWPSALKVIPNRYAKEMAEGMEAAQAQKAEQEQAQVQQAQQFESRNDEVEDSKRTNVNVNIKGEDLDKPIVQEILVQNEVLGGQGQEGGGQQPVQQTPQSALTPELAQVLGGSNG